MTTAEAATAILAPPAEPRSWSRRRLLAGAAIGLALLSAFLTFVVLLGLSPIVPTHEIVIRFLAVNAVTILLLLAIIGFEVWGRSFRHAGGGGRHRDCMCRSSRCFRWSRCCPRCWSPWSPTSRSTGVWDRLFQPDEAVIENSVVVANAYLNEHARLIRGDILGMASDLVNARPLFDQDRESFRRYLTTGAQARNLPGAMLIDKDRMFFETAATGIRQSFTTPAPEFLSNVTEDEPQMAVFIEQNYVAAVIRLRAYENTFLYVARLLDPRVVDQCRRRRRAWPSLRNSNRDGWGFRSRSR